METTRSRYTPKLVRDTRGAQAAKFTADIAKKGSEMYDQATKASLAKKLGMKMLTKEAETQKFDELTKRHTNLK